VPRFTGKGEKVSTGVIKGQQGDTYSVQVSWVGPIGEYMDPKTDPRVQAGGVFSIALPLCAR
jgi:hypothetical protein